jgi:hypothetical protein
MRAPALAALAMLALALAPPAGAHGPASFPHVNPLPVTLAPGEQKAVDIAFDEEMADGTMANGTFQQGWVFLLNAKVADGSGPVDAALRLGHQEALRDVVANWTVAAGPTQHLSARMPATDFYVLTLRNPGAANASITFFYDQSCNCAGKPVPTEVPDGIVVFNVDLKQGRSVDAVIPEPPALRLKVDAALLASPRARWPDDFRVLASSAAPRTTAEGARVHEFHLAAEQDERIYFFAEATGVDAAKLDRSSPERYVASLTITPYYDTGQAKAVDKTPLGAEVPLAALALAALAGAAARRR